MSPGMSDRKRSFLPSSYQDPNTRTLDAHVLPVEARVPPKPHGPSGDPSGSKAGPSQAKYSLNPPGQLQPVHLGTHSTASLLKHAHCIAKLSKLAVATLSTYHPAVPSLDIFHPEVSKLANTLPNEIPRLHRARIFRR